MKTLAIVFALVASSCASVPKASVQADTQAKAFATRTDKCGLYVYRNESLGAAARMDVMLDEKPFGATAAKTFLFTWLEPGEHKLLSKAEHDSTLHLDAKAGQLVFVWQEVKWGFISAGCLLHAMDEAAGKAGVRECDLAESMP